jgi:hypothetical protein
MATAANSVRANIFLIDMLVFMLGYRSWKPPTRGLFRFGAERRWLTSGADREVRKATLASILRKSRPGVRLNEHLAHDCGLTVFQHACKIGLEGIVSKRLGSRYRSGRSPDWLKFKNPEALAVKREAEQDWGRWHVRVVACDKRRRRLGLIGQ